MTLTPAALARRGARALLRPALPPGAPPPVTDSVIVAALCAAGLAVLGVPVAVNAGHPQLAPLFLAAAAVVGAVTFWPEDAE